MTKDRNELLNETEMVVSRIKENFDSLFEIMKMLSYDKTEVIFERNNACLDCEHWATDSEFCNKFNQRPPVKIIVNAERDCPEFKIYIPF